MAAENLHEQVRYWYGIVEVFNPRVFKSKKGGCIGMRQPGQTCIQVIDGKGKREVVCKLEFLRRCKGDDPKLREAQVAFQKRHGMVFS